MSCIKKKTTTEIPSSTGIKPRRRRSTNVVMPICASGSRSPEQLRISLENSGERVAGKRNESGGIVQCADHRVNKMGALTLGLVFDCSTNCPVVKTDCEARWIVGEPKRPPVRTGGRSLEARGEIVSRIGAGFRFRSA